MPLRRADAVEIRQERWPLKTLAGVVSRGGGDAGGRVDYRWGPCESRGMSAAVGGMAVEEFGEEDSVFIRGICIESGICFEGLSRTYLKGGSWASRVGVGWG